MPKGDPPLAALFRSWRARAGAAARRGGDSAADMRYWLYLGGCFSKAALQTGSDHLSAQFEAALQLYGDDALEDEAWQEEAGEDAAASGAVEPPARWEGREGWALLRQVSHFASILTRSELHDEEKDGKASDDGVTVDDAVISHVTRVLDATEHPDLTYWTFLGGRLSGSLDAGRSVMQVVEEEKVAVEAVISAYHRSSSDSKEEDRLVPRPREPSVADRAAVDELTEYIERERLTGRLVFIQARMRGWLARVRLYRAARGRAPTDVHTRLRKRFMSTAHSILHSKHVAVLRKRNALLRDLLKSEEEYTRRLGIVVSLYIEPMRTKRLLPESRLREVFCNVDLIHAVHLKLLGDLRTRLDAWPLVLVGDLFQHVVDVMRVYKTYADNFSRSQAARAHIFTRSSSLLLHIFLEEQERRMRELDVSYDLPSLLLAPLQRIPQYVTVLEELLRYTTHDHVDAENLHFALHSLRRISSLLNEQESSAVAMKRLEELETAMGHAFEPVEPVLQMGWLVKRGRIFRTWKKRLFILKGSTLYYFQPKQLKRYRGHMLLREATLQGLRSSVMSGVVRVMRFSLSTDKRQLVMEAEESVARKWVRTLSWAIEAARGDAYKRLATPPRTLVRSEVVDVVDLKDGARSTYTLHLTSDLLVYASTLRGGSGGTRYKTSLHLAGLTVEERKLDLPEQLLAPLLEETQTGRCLRIDGPGVKHLLIMPSARCKREWVLDLVAQQDKFRQVQALSEVTDVVELRYQRTVVEGRLSELEDQRMRCDMALKQRHAHGSELIDMVADYDSFYDIDRTLPVFASSAAWESLMRDKMDNDHDIMKLTDRTQQLSAEITASLRERDYLTRRIEVLQDQVELEVAEARALSTKERTRAVASIRNRGKSR